MAKLIAALVLCDVVAHGLKAGQIVEASPDVVASLGKSGDVDAHKDAVAHARSQGAKVVRSSIEIAAERRAAEQDALRVEIAKLDDLAAKPETDQATKDSLAGKVIELRAQLAALGA